MIRITKITDYGFQLLVYMARQGEECVQSAKGLSEAIDLPLPTVSKVLKLLSQGGLLSSIRGSRGGYVLTRSPERITASEIVESFEGPVAITDCSGSAGCSRDCPVGRNWRNVNRRIASVLSDLTLADLAK